MTVLFCFHDANKNSGATRSLIDIIDNLLLKDNVKIVAAFPVKNGTAIDYLKSKGVAIVPFCYGRWDYPCERHNNLRNYYLTAQNALSGIKTHVFLLAVKKIIRQYDIDVIYNNTITLPVGALIKRRYGIPLIWHVREFGYEDHKLGILGGYGRLYRYMNRYADRIIIISESLADKYRGFFDNNKLRVVYNDISPDFIVEDRPALDLKKKCDILIAGTIQPGKCQLDVIQAVEKVRSNKGYEHVNLYIAGNTRGDYYQLLKKYVIDNNLENHVHFLGFIKDMNSLRKTMDIAAVASSSEAFGRVTVEAMLAGLLVIGAAAAGTSELISDGENGLLYEKNNVDDLANTIISAIDRQDIDTIACHGRLDAIQKYTTGRSSARIYDELVDLSNRR